MSTSSARRIKERGGGGGKVAAAPTGKVLPVSGRSISTGKENPRATSGVRAATQKPSIRPMARTDKSAAAAPAVDERRSRWSTSSVPRGRSSSPSEFTRVLSDLRKYPSVASLGPSQRKVNGVNLKDLDEKSCVKSHSEERVVKDLVKNEDSFGELGRGLQEKEKNKIGFLNNENGDIKERNLGSVSVERSDLKKRVSKVLEKYKENPEEFKGDYQENEKFSIGVSTGNIDEKQKILSWNTVKRLDTESLNENSSLQPDHKIYEVSETGSMISSAVGVPSGLISRESKMGNKVSNGAGVISEHLPNKLREKVAFLEGKVKRIASDISRTKEILDKNNPDASKVMLSDIQEKITGIERAMGHVRSEKTGLVKSIEHQDTKEEKDFMGAKSLVKGLNIEELEARLFPHRKLMRDRSLSKTVSRDSDSHHVLKSGESTITVNVQEKMSTFEDDAIVLEFPASWRKEESLGGREESKIQEMDDTVTYVAESSSLNALDGEGNIDALLMADEKLNEFDDQEKVPVMAFEDEVEENCTYKLNDIGSRTSTGGWFVSEGESVLLAHDDSSCSFYDIANCEEKAEYKPPAGVVPNMWQDCWIIRAPSADGCSGKYVVAASAGNSMDTGFCSWDFYTKEVQAFHIEGETARVRTALAPLPNNTMHRRNAMSTYMSTENRQWWYNPCGPLITSTATCQRVVQIYDIRDGEQVMKWELQRPVLSMDYASPLHWINRGKVVIAESDFISLWDVSSLSSQAVMSVCSSGRRISALHVNNTDAEMGGGIRKRISSGEAEGNDGVFCTPDSINVLDFRNPSGVGLKIPKIGVSVQSAFSRGDSIFIGCSSLKSVGKKQYSSEIQQFSLRKQRLLSAFALPESNAHSQFTALTQVWGDSSHVMGVCGLGLFVFDSFKEDGLLYSSAADYGTTQNVKEIVGPDDMYYPSFDYSSSRVLLISKDRPAKWRYLM